MRDPDIRSSSGDVTVVHPYTYGNAQQECSSQIIIGIENMVVTIIVPENTVEHPESQAASDAQALHLACATAESFS
jgi:hypothetical protein